MEQATQENKFLVRLPFDMLTFSSSPLVSQLQTQASDWICPSCQIPLLFVPHQLDVIEHYRCTKCRSSFFLQSQQELEEQRNTSTHHRYITYQTDENVAELEKILEKIYFSFWVKKRGVTLDLTSEQVAVLSRLILLKM